jgi:hypothetical protein
MRHLLSIPFYRPRRHAEALTVTLDRIRTRINEGYAELHQKIDELDYESERLAEEELAGDVEMDPEVEKAMRESKEQFELDQAIRDIRD